MMTFNQITEGPILVQSFAGCGSPLLVVRDEKVAKFGNFLIGRPGPAYIGMVH